MKIRKGDRINVTDGSWVFGVCDGEYQNGISNGGNNRDHLLVVSDGLQVSNNGTGDGMKDDPCQVLATNGNGDFWFVPEKHCRLVDKHRITIDGKDIDLSEESFNELKRQLT
jgi:hypothetical protein